VKYTVKLSEKQIRYLAALVGGVSPKVEEDLNLSKSVGTKVWIKLHKRLDEIEANR
jgi:hypothetical protein